MVPYSCPSCGVIGPRHGSDADCIVALRLELAKPTGTQKRSEPPRQNVARSDAA